MKSFEFHVYSGRFILSPRRSTMKAPSRKIKNPFLASWNILNTILIPQGF